MSVHLYVYTYGRKDKQMHIRINRVTDVYKYW